MPIIPNMTPSPMAAMPPPPGGAPPMPMNPQGMAQALDRVRSLQKQAFSDRASKAMRDAKMALGIALQDVALRSPVVAKHISTALENVSKAEAELKKLQEMQAQVNQPPPNLAGMSRPGMPGMGGAIPPPMGMPQVF